jgi:hypothetical protein
VLFVRLDATLIEADSTKTGAAGNYRGGFGFHPLTVPRSRLALQIGRLSPCGYVPNDQDCSILCERRHLQSRELVRMFPLRIYTLSRRDLLRGPPLVSAVPPVSVLDDHCPHLRDGAAPVTAGLAPPDST